MYTKLEVPNFVRSAVKIGLVS